jgi:hypothetical protein
MLSESSMTFYSCKKNVRIGKIFAMLVTYEEKKRANYV